MRAQVDLPRRLIGVFGRALLLTALSAALLVAGLTGLLFRAGTLAIVPPVVTAVHSGGLRVSSRCDHYPDACETRQGGEN